MMLVRSTILMPSSAPGIVLSCAGRSRETAIALTWRHAVGNCDAKRGRKSWTCAPRCAVPRCNARREAVAAIASLVRDLGYEDWLARQFAVDPDHAIDPEHYFI